jgi:molybdate transport system ATP-binding protein
VAGEVKPNALTAQVRAERNSTNSGAPSFLLDVSIEVRPGVTILFGPSGAGKSTVLDCIAGLLRPHSGRIVSGDVLLFDSAASVNLPPQERRIAYVFQSPALFPHMSVKENVGYGLAHLQQAERGARIATILEAFRVEKLSSRKPGEISGGEQQRVALARSLVTSPRVLLLDEPLTGLDAGLKGSIVNDLRAWNAAQQIPILYVTHSRDEVDALGERVIALEHGRVVGEGHPREVLEVPRRKKLAQAAGFENLLSATVVDLRETDGVMRVRLEGSISEIEVPLGYASPGDCVRVAVRAGDIMLAAQHPDGLSARNVIYGTIESLERRGALVVARVNCVGVVFVSHVTPGATRALELAVGRAIWIVLKTHSCYLVAE